LTLYTVCTSKLAVNAARDENDAVLPMDGERYRVTGCCGGSGKYWVCSEVGVLALDDAGVRWRCSSLNASLILEERRLRDCLWMDLGVRGDRIESSAMGVLDSSDRWVGRFLTGLDITSDCMVWENFSVFLFAYLSKVIVRGSERGRAGKKKDFLK